MASLLPNGEQQFCDASGAPYGGGSVYFYVPNTLTFKDTYQDIGQTILNTNPVVLDAAGRAIIFGNGQYRQILRDSLANLIWDQTTSSVVSQAMEAVVEATTLSAAMTALGISLAMQPVVGAATLAAARTAMGVAGVGDVVNITAAPSISVAPTGNPSIATLASFNVQATTTSAIAREFLATIGLTIATGNGATGNLQDKVALYAGADMVAGAGDGWAFNTVTNIESAAPVTSNAYGYELDFNNLNADRGNAAAGAGLAAPVAYGLAITGASTHKSTAGLLIGGASNIQWNRGIVLTDAVIQAGIQDLSNSTKSIEIFGSHDYGIDLYQGAFTDTPIRIGNATWMKARNAANSGDIELIGLDAANNVLVGGPSGVVGTFVYSPFFPSTDNNRTLGGPSNRWSVVYAGTGAINTSDAADKVVRGAPTDAELTAWASVPIKVYQMTDGTRSHVGYVAQDVAAEFAAQGLDPATYGLWCRDTWTTSDGAPMTRQGLRYDECAVMEAAAMRKRVADLEARIAVLEAK